MAVADPTREDLYVPALEALGYELRVREPSWHQHRCLQLASPRVNLHVFGPDCPEAIRHRMFRDWLRGSARIGSGMHRPSRARPAIRRT